MDKAIAKCGVLTKKEGRLRRSTSRWYVLTNQGGLFESRDPAASFDSLKPYLCLYGNAKVTMEKSVPASPGDASYVIKVDTRGRNGSQKEFGAASDAEIMSWYKVMQDVIELVGAINGDEKHAPPRLMTGGRIGAEGWYTEAAGRIALYTRLYELNSMKRENASLSTSTKEEVGIENTNSSSSGEGNDALAPELEKRNNLGRDEGVQTTDGEDASLSATMKEQVETNRCLEERIAALTTELERRNTERDEEHRRQLHNRLDAIDQLEQENGQLQAKIRRHDEILSRLREGYEDGMQGLRDAKTRLDDERRCFEAARRGFDVERGELRDATARLKDETKSLEISRNDFERETEEHAITMSRLEADINDTWASLGSLASLPESSRQALGSIAGGLEGVLEECIVCCEPLLSGFGNPSFGVTSYSCGCSRGGHVRALHVNCIVSMSNRNCPLCSEEVILIAPSLMTPTAVRCFTIKKTGRLAESR